MNLLILNKSLSGFSDLYDLHEFVKLVYCDVNQLYEKADTSINDSSGSFFWAI